MLLCTSHKRGQFRLLNECVTFRRICITVFAAVLCISKSVIFTVLEWRDFVMLLIEVTFFQELGSQDELLILKTCSCWKETLCLERN